MSIYGQNRLINGVEVVVKIRSLKSKESVRAQSGAAIVEFALIAGIFMMLLFAIVEFARLFTIQSMLTKGAQDALNLALKVDPLDVDLRKLKNNAVDNAKYVRFKAARQAAAQRGLHLPTSAFIKNDPAFTPAGLIPFSYQDATGAAGSKKDTLSVAILRPGEKVSFDNPVTGTTETLQHPTLCSVGTSASPPLSCARAIKKTDNWQEVIIDEPYVVTLMARVKLLIPFVGRDLLVRGSAIGHRESVAVSQLANVAPPTTTPPVSPSPSPSPSPSAAPPGGPTATPTPSPTPTPTPGQSPSPTASPSPTPVCELSTEICAQHIPPRTFDASECKCVRFE